MLHVSDCSSELAKLQEILKEAELFGPYGGKKLIDAYNHVEIFQAQRILTTELSSPDNFSHLQRYSNDAYTAVTVFDREVSQPLRGQMHSPSISLAP